MKLHIRRLLNDDAIFANGNGTSSSLSHQQQLPGLPYYNYSERRPFNPTANFDTSMAVTILVLLTALFLMGFFSVYVRRFAEQNAAAAEVARRRRQRRGGQPSWVSPPHGLDPATVCALPVFAYDGSVKACVDCAVCLSEFEERETVKVIPSCGHVFHPVCIDSWLFCRGSCPLCRCTRLLPPQEDVRVEVFDEMPQIACDETGEEEAGVEERERERDRENERSGEEE